jgi:DNA-binding MarR family transcriptional regulator
MAAADEWNSSVAAAPDPVSDAHVHLLRETVVALVRRDSADLSARQLGVFLICYLNDGGHTVRGLAAEMNVSKPAITRALDRLGEFDLARRKTDPSDRRSVLVQRTTKGGAFLREIPRLHGRSVRRGKESRQEGCGLRPRRMRHPRPGFKPHRMPGSQGFAFAGRTPAGRTPPTWPGRLDKLLPCSGMSRTTHGSALPRRHDGLPNRTAPDLS